MREPLGLLEQQMARTPSCTLAPALRARPDQELVQLPPRDHVPVVVPFPYGRHPRHHSVAPAADDAVAPHRREPACEDVRLEAQLRSITTLRGARPSPQIFSRGKRARSTTSTSTPDSARNAAAAAPAGPAPTITTSATSSLIAPPPSPPGSPAGRSRLSPLYDATGYPSSANVARIASSATALSSKATSTVLEATSTCDLVYRAHGSERLLDRLGTMSTRPHRAPCRSFPSCRLLAEPPLDPTEGVVLGLWEQCYSTNTPYPYSTARGRT